MEEPDVPVDASGYTTPPAVDNDAPTATPSPSAETTDLPNNDLTKHGNNIANPSMDPMRDPDAPETQREDDADSVLSDLDDEAFADYNEVDIGRETIPIDADTVGAIGKFKKKRTTGEGQPVKRKERRVREKRGRGVESEDEGDGPVREQVVELTEEESRFPVSSPPPAAVYWVLMHTRAATRAGKANGRRGQRSQESQKTQERPRSRAHGRRGP